MASALLMGERDFPSATPFNLRGIDMDDMVKRLSGRSPYGGGDLSLDDVCREMWCVAEQLEAELGWFVATTQRLHRRLDRARERKHPRPGWCAFCGEQRTCAGCVEAQRKSMGMFDALMGADVMVGMLDVFGPSNMEMQMFAGFSGKVAGDLTLDKLNADMEALRRKISKPTRRRPFGWM